MTFLVQKVRFADTRMTRMCVDLTDSRVIGVPLAWFPSLLKATSLERENYQISRCGIHWTALDETVSVDGLLADCDDITYIADDVA